MQFLFVSMGLAHFSVGFQKVIPGSFSFSSSGNVESRNLTQFCEHPLGVKDWA